MFAEPRLVYITAADAEEATKIARALVEERLAACANILDPMRSVFRWEGEIQEGSETVLIVKTTADRVAALTDRVMTLHSYDCPVSRRFRSTRVTAFLNGSRRKRPHGLVAVVHGFRCGAECL